MQVENGKKTLILHGTKTSATVSSVLMELYRLKKGGAIKYSRRNENIRPFESGGETSLEFFSLKTDCSIFVVSFMSCFKKKPVAACLLLLLSQLGSLCIGFWLCNHLV